MKIKSTSHAPLEILVQAGLNSLRQQDEEPQNRLRSGRFGEMPEMATELWQLQINADRLGRMVDAMTLG